MNSYQSILSKPEGGPNEKLLLMSPRLSRAKTFLGDKGVKIGLLIPSNMRRRLRDNLLFKW